MTIELWLGFALVFSISINAVLLWLSVKQSGRLSYISENIDDLLEIIENYKNHLKKIYDMEMFYGDETLEFLMDHTRSFIDILETEYGDITFISEPLQIEYEEEEEIAEETLEQKEKDVFYAGSRRRDS
tara:strand:- start:4055 stop:4441 length:387 start_codon:yes stop_codon:yes gene_type:complete